MSNQLEGLLDSSLYAYTDHPEHITIKRRDLEVCLRAAISSVICEGGNIASVSRDCMCALDALEEAHREDHKLREVLDASGAEADLCKA